MPGTTFRFTIQLIERETIVWPKISICPDSEDDIIFDTLRSHESASRIHLLVEEKDQSPFDTMQSVREQAIKPSFITTKNNFTPNCSSAPCDDVSIQVNENERSSSCQCEQRNQILIVDDNVFNVMTLQCILKESAGVESDAAVNGEEAVERVRARACGRCGHSYRLVVMDCNMPVMDGFTATRLIRAQFPDVYIIALTAYTTEEFRKKCFQAGMHEYATKPIVREKVMEWKKLLQTSPNY